MKPVLAVLAAIWLAGCATPVANPDRQSGNLHVETGVPGCAGCTRLRLFRSGMLGDGMHEVKGNDGRNTGEYIAASYWLGATNREVMPDIGLNQYLLKLKQGPHLFEGHPKADAAHPYHFFVRVHKTLKYQLSTNPTVWLVSETGEYAPLRSVKFDGQARRQLNCHSTGCTWDDDYIIPFETLQRSMAQQAPLKLFVGDRVSKQVKSANGFDRNYRIADVGVTLVIQPAYLQNFTAEAEKNL